MERTRQSPEVGRSCQVKGQFPSDGKSTEAQMATPLIMDLVPKRQNCQLHDRASPPADAHYRNGRR